MTSEHDNNKYSDNENLVGQVDNLADQAKMLALNLAITLARKKTEIEDLTILEPEFTKLINNSVNVIREITKILRTFQGKGQSVSKELIEKKNFDHIETSLNEILCLSHNVLKAVRALKEQKDIVDKYE
jgi:methyl-accepting chemotaxis protein